MRRGGHRAVGRAGIRRPGLRAGRAAWFAWIAVVAILLQTLIPDFAMGARAAGLPGGTVERLCLAEPPPHRAEPSGAKAPGLGGQDSPCAFCLALSAHGLAPVLGVDGARTAYADVLEPPLGAGVVPRSLLRDSLSPRAPPRG